MIKSTFPTGLGVAHLLFPLSPLYPCEIIHLSTSNCFNVKLRWGSIPEGILHRGSSRIKSRGENPSFLLLLFQLSGVASLETTINIK